MQIKSFSAFTAFSIHPMLCRLQRIPGVDVRNIGLEAMTNDASGFPYHDNLQVLNDNHFMGEAQETTHTAIYHFDYRKTVRNGAVKAIASDNY
jgi:hypothetical protein